jgi:hypothetical protein
MLISNACEQIGHMGGLIVVSTLPSDRDRITFAQQCFDADQSCRDAAQNRRRDAQTTIDLQAAEELERARNRKRRPDPTPDKINETFKRATSC